MVLIGESINGTIEKVGKAILEKDESFLRGLARNQYEQGADVLDVNAGVASGNEVEDLPWLVSLVQDEIPVPLMIDSANPDALEAALRVYRHQEPPILNSVSGEKEKLAKMLAVLEKKKCGVVALCMDESGIPRTVEERLSVAERVYTALKDIGLPDGSIYFDPLVLSVGIEPEQGLVTLDTTKALKNRFPQSHIICGVSNVSMGLPGRRLINRLFLVAAMTAGLDALLVDVRDQALLSSIYGMNVLMNNDPYAREYIQRYRSQKIVV